MPRPAKCRHVCTMPDKSCFSPEQPDIEDSVTLTVEEYETLRLIDYIGLTQEECAAQMGVARTTIQRIYTDARRKVSVFLVEGLRLSIRGGSYKLCPRRDCEGCRKPCRKAIRKDEDL